MIFALSLSISVIASDVTMGVTKQYLRVAPGPVFGVVASQKANIITLPGTTGHPSQCAVGACENVIMWDLATKQKVNLIIIII